MKKLSIKLVKTGCGLQIERVFTKKIRDNLKPINFNSKLNKQVL